MTAMFSTLGTWNWLIFGVVLMALELLAPGVFLFWLGLAALLVGLLSQQEQPFSQQACRCAGRPGVHAGKADHRRGRHSADRRYDLACRRP